MYNFKRILHLRELEKYFEQINFQYYTKIGLIRKMITHICSLN
jgi:glutaredoxin-related protein